MPSEHALLSPSSAERWIHCPASIRAAEHAPDDESRYAREGTAAHGLAELKNKHAFGQLSDADFEAGHARWLEAADEGWDTAEMERHTDEFLELIRDRVAEHPLSTVLFEQRVQTGIPKCWGTADVVIISPTHIEVIDLKYGQGIRVSATENPQLMLYGVGALETFDQLIGDTEWVRVTVHQPRLDSTSSYDIDAAELRRWRDQLLPIATSALDGSGHFGPSEEACRFCPIKGDCRAHMEYVTREDFGDPVTLTDAELADAQRRLAEIRAWCTAVEERALHRAYSEGAELPGLKVVISGGQRKVVDEDAALERMVNLGIGRSELLTPAKLVGIGQLEKAIKARYPERGTAPKLEDVLGDALGRTTGRPSLVPDDDHRPSIDPASQARKDFDL